MTASMIQIFVFITKQILLKNEMNQIWSAEKNSLFTKMVNASWQLKCCIFGRTFMHHNWCSSRTSRSRWFYADLDLSSYGTTQNCYQIKSLNCSLFRFLSSIKNIHCHYPLSCFYQMKRELLGGAKNKIVAWFSCGHVSCMIKWGT